MDLSAVSLVSRRLHNLVTTPHAWRVAFARYFSGPDSLSRISKLASTASEDDENNFKSEKRAFTRLTTLASWRSEYILRTRLLRSLSRGKPIPALQTPAAIRMGQHHAPSAVTMYNSQLFTIVNHLHATFGTTLNKRFPKFIHGADDVGAATLSDPLTSKVESWGSSDVAAFVQFADIFPGVAQYGLGSGEIVGIPNVMDVSQPHGMALGEGYPGGIVYFRHAEESRGRALAGSSGFSSPGLGIPKILATDEATCSIWIAKSTAIPYLTEGLIGLMTGSSVGIVTAYSLGSDGLRESRLTRGELTARWVLSPGVPIIAISVDETYSLKRHAQNRIWAVALNALGEVFYLTKFPKRPTSDRSSKMSEETREQLSWTTGRSVFWNLVELSRRTARPDPYKDSRVDGSYFPRSSWNGMCLTENQIAAETSEIEGFLQERPKNIQKLCIGWDMRRRLEVDFAGDDGNMAGEAVCVFACGLDEETVASVQRYSRCKVEQSKEFGKTASIEAFDLTPTVERGSLFGGSIPIPTSEHPLPVGKIAGRSISRASTNSSPEPIELLEDWRKSIFSFNGYKSIQITATAIDNSAYSTLTLSEDPALGFAGMSNASTPFASPTLGATQPVTAADIPGQRARFVTAGTNTGSVFLWDIRSPVPRSADLTNTVDPLRIIHTESPEISCLALSALYLVHGGNDGLVQAWDPLASTLEPIRTLHSRFSSRARRRLVQAQASPQGVGINMFAAGAICLDPDPTVLRGMVTLGTHLRYWGYSSSAADQYKSKKRQLRFGERSNNGGGDRFSATGRGNMKDYIANEKVELEREKKERERRAKHLGNRFGVDLLSSEEEAMAYARMLSEESLAEDRKRRESQSTSGVVTPPTSSDPWTPLTATPEGSAQTFTSPVPVKSDEEFDADLAEAIRLSLGGEIASPSTHISTSPPDQNSAYYDVPIRYAKSKKSPSGSKRGSPKTNAESSRKQELDDLEFALQLSLAEEESKKAGENDQDDFPALKPLRGNAKGKGKHRA